RFPGGCLVHGNGLGNIYRWKDSVGPRETRRQQHSIWRRHQSLGLGFFEYFQFCEDIGAWPLPVVAAGVSCQNSGCTCGGGQRPIPLAEMPAYIQDVLDLIEYANGPADSPWGAVRAAAGHPEPFHLRHLGVGNEDKITPDFEARFRLIHDALRARHPEITVIGTVGPAAEGEDYEKGWAFARELGLPMVDEHYYKPAAWFWENLHRYDAYDRAGSRVYLGEYAAHEEDRRSTLRSALAEAAHLTALERNGDIVAFASYAPLLAKRGHTDWSPDLIYFTNASVYPTINYEIQRLFSLHAGDHWLPARLDPAPAPGERLAVSTVRDSASGDLIVKLVNGDASARALRLEAPAFAFATAVATTLSAPDDSVAREDDRPDPVSLLTVPLTRSADGSLVHTLPAFSLTILRLSAAHPEAPSR
nr:alpha-N-arabinofuranosidase [Opitutaceae bacterium]